MANSRTKKSRLRFSRDFYLALVVVGFVILVIVTHKLLDPGESDAPIPCVKEGEPLSQHSHTRFEILADGRKEEIPADIGISRTCTRVIHTHESGGEIHLEANDTDRYYLGQFFEI